MFTKQHFEAVAKVIDKARINADGATTLEIVDVIAVDFADLFAASNPRFDRERFMRAAGYES